MKGRKTGGRVAGTPNKLSASVKQALAEAYDQLGGDDGLVKWGKKKPDLFYALWGRMLPHEHDVTSNGQTLEALVAGSRRPE